MNNLHTPYDEIDELLQREIVGWLALVSGGIVGWYEIIKFLTF